MEKKLVICEKFKAFDIFIKQSVEPLVKPGYLYQIVCDHEGMHLVLNEDGNDIVVYLMGLESDKDPRYQYKFIEVTPFNSLYAKSDYPEKHIEFINSDTNPIDKLREEFNSPRSNEQNDEMEGDHIYSLTDEQFIVEMYSELRRSDNEAAEGLISSFEFTSEAWNAMEKIPSNEPEAIRMLEKYIEQYKESGSEVDMGLAQLMMYYIFNMIKDRV